MHALPNSVPPTLQQGTIDPHLCWRLLDTQGKVWVSLLWGHCSFLLGPGVYKIQFVSSKSLFHESFVSSGSSMGGNLLQESLFPTQVCWTQIPSPCLRPMLTHTSIGDIQRQV